MNQTLTQTEEEFDEITKLSELTPDSKEKLKTFLTQSNLRVIEKVKEMVGEDESLPKNKCINLESHLTGRCFECEKTKARNEERQRIRNLLSLIEQK